jgi:hypothetical protein
MMDREDYLEDAEALTLSPERPPLKWGKGTWQRVDHRGISRNRRTPTEYLRELKKHTGRKDFRFLSYTPEGFTQRHCPFATWRNRRYNAGGHARKFCLPVRQRSARYRAQGQVRLCESFTPTPAMHLRPFGIWRNIKTDFTYMFAHFIS